jgi:hypothetical protein
MYNEILLIFLNFQLKFAIVTIAVYMYLRILCSSKWILQASRDILTLITEFQHLGGIWQYARYSTNTPIC